MVDLRIGNADMEKEVKGEIKSRLCGRGRVRGWCVSDVIGGEKRTRKTAEGTEGLWLKTGDSDEARAARAGVRLL